MAVLNKNMENEVIRNLSRLEKQEQDRVFSFIKSLLQTKSQSKKNDFLRFAGSFDEVSIKEMSEAIKAGCENIDKNEW